MIGSRTAALLALTTSLTMACLNPGPSAGATSPTSRAKPDPAAVARRVAQSVAGVGVRDSGVSLTQERIQRSHGLTYVPYQRSYRHLPVIGGDFVVMLKGEATVAGTSVARRQVSVPSTTPAISRDRAARVAASKVRTPMADGRGRLVVFADQIATPRLAWEQSVHGTRNGRRSRLTVYVDAQTARVLATREHLLAGEGRAAVNGPSPIHLDTVQSHATFSMTTPGATSLRCQNFTGGATFTGSDDRWGNGDPTNRETGCVDALFAAQTLRSMLTTWLGRNGMNGAGGWVPIQVGLDDVNAYYDGQRVAIGHSLTGNRWLSEIDVVAHEFGHGIDDTTPGGISGGGTQEFVADTFGAAAEWFAHESSPYDTPDFTVGEKVNLLGKGPIRYMYDPALAGDDDCYSSKTSSAEVHAAAGPGNHWFYLVAEGNSPRDGQPASPTCNGGKVQGLGVQKAITIMYNAMLQKTTGASYPRYRVWTLTAAKNLYGCDAFATVKAAWDAVSVKAQRGEPTCAH